MSNIVKVSMADLNVANSPHKIRTLGLGSCVGVVIYDERKKACGMAHVMLPSSDLGKSKLNRAKYADTAIEDLLYLLMKMNVSRTRLKAKVAGGAQMFSFASTNEVMRIGPRNIEAVRDELRTRKIPLVGEDVGGESGRTIEFDPETAQLEVRTVNQGVKVI
ncbi:chemotaxis protein CheD [Alteribacter populi]|uniref:chemotaxis protein CheD n=1 Tax=Alteribacter populi TaxID=2011011 RepID=UPI000BBAA86F|nr:chemotaxis protein CheD [Alteribacter populi]